MVASRTLSSTISRSTVIPGRRWAGSVSSSVTQHAEHLLARRAALPHVRLLRQLLDQRHRAPVALSALRRGSHAGLLPLLHRGDVHLADLAAHLHPARRRRSSPAPRPTPPGRPGGRGGAPASCSSLVSITARPAAGAVTRALGDLLVHLGQFPLRLRHLDARFLLRGRWRPPSRSSSECWASFSAALLDPGSAPPSVFSASACWARLLLQVELLLAVGLLRVRQLRARRGSSSFASRWLRASSRCARAASPPRTSPARPASPAPPPPCLLRRTSGISCAVSTSLSDCVMRVWRPPILRRPAFSSASVSARAAAVLAGPPGPSCPAGRRSRRA